jgi:proton-dependent oligopeptide transporter, POT family
MADSAVAADLAPAIPYDTSGLAGHPSGLTTLFLTEMWERLSYYGMRALLILFMTAPLAAGGLAFPTEKAAAIYGLYTASVYFTSIPGGWIADRLLGLRRAVLCGAILIALGHYSMFLNRLPFFYAGLVLIVLGTGLLKGNISAIVGSLYAPDDKRRDAGFSIFYMGINTGALMGPIICGTLGEKVGWHWGFGAAGIGMTFGIVQYVLGQHRFGSAGLLREKPESPAKLWGIVVAGLLGLATVFYYLWDYRDYVLIVGTVALFTYFWRQAQPGLERKRLAAIIVLFLFAMLFWGGFEQAGSSFNLFARDVTDRVIAGWEFPASWFQSVNSIFLVALAPVLTMLWAWLGRREPSSPAKFAYGLLFVGLGFLVIAGAALVSIRAGGAKVSIAWLIVLYLCHTIGELCLSPVGLSTVTKLAPQRLVGSMMGVWFLALSLGNFIGGRVAGLFETFPLPQLFGAVFLTSAFAALVLALLSKPIRRLMSGVH